MITVIAVGKRHEDWIGPGVERYQKRLKRPYDIEWKLLPHSALQGDAARKEESLRITRSFGKDDHVILLDERGKTVGSSDLVDIIGKAQLAARHVCFVIGGAYGVDDDLRNRADAVISLSALVFPHQLVRLILTEQLYRAQQIVVGGKYHHE